MVTEELNEYVFAGMVMKSAWSIRCNCVFALRDSGEITEEQVKNMPQTVADVREALKVIQHNKKVVFDILEELESAPADSQIPTQDTP